MIEPRVVLRTHYQVDEPAILLVLVRECASPVKSAYKETLATKLVGAIAERGGTLNLAAAGYAIDLGKAVGLLTDNYSWSATGHLLALVAESPSQIDSDLSVEARLALSCCLVPADAAAFSYFARRVDQDGEVPKGQGWDAIASEMVTDILQDYLAIVTDPQSRTRIRQLLEKRRKQPYRGKSGPHQVFFHLQAMRRLGLLDQLAGRTYGVESETTRRRLSAFMAQLGSVQGLEQTLAQQEWWEIAGNIWGQASTKRCEDSAIRRDIARSYKATIASGVQLAPLITVSGYAAIKSIVGGYDVANPHRVIALLKEQQKSLPRDVRLHVDRYGHPAFVKITETALKELAAPKH